MANPTCPENCDAPLPIMTFSENCNPEFNPSQIEYLLIAKGNADPITDVTDVDELNSRISNTSTDANAIRKVIVKGSIPAPTDQEYTGTLNRKKVVSRENTLNASIDETNDAIYNAFREMQCGGGYMIWAVTKSKHLLGGSKGLGEDYPLSLKITFVFNEDDTAVLLIQLVLTWQGMFAPERNKWVLAGGGYGVVNYDSILLFASATTDTDSGVSAIVAAVNATQKFEFVSKSSPTGTPNAMTINVGGTQAASVDFPSDYAGTPFRYTHTTGTVYTGTFINGTRNF